MFIDFLGIEKNKRIYQYSNYDAAIKFAACFKSDYVLIEALNQIILI